MLHTILNEVTAIYLDKWGKILMKLRLNAEKVTYEFCVYKT